jgi:hypothetical protein
MSESTDVQVRCKEGVRDTSKPLYTNGTRAARAVLLGQAGVGPPTPSSRSLSLSLSPDSLSVQFSFYFVLLHYNYGQEFFQLSRTRFSPT